MNILVIDDEALIRQSLRKVLQDEGFEVAVASSCATAWEAFVSGRPDVVLLDLVLPDGDGLDLLRRMREGAPETKVVIISAHASIESAVRAMKLGAYDYIRKPFDIEEIVATVRNAARTTALEGRLEYLSQRERAQPGQLVLQSAQMARVLAEVDIIAQNPVPLVLVTGESGTGKQLIARRLHERSARAAGPFVELNCSAVPENLAESELFGHERGAFSDARERKLGLVEVADGGTLFLDEIGDLGAPLQAKLLTFLEQRSFRRVGATAVRRVDTRIVAATHRDLQAMVQARTFREDLWYRISAITVHLPPLRERPDDIAPLAEHFLRQARAEFGRRFTGVSTEALGILRRHTWPGNVRELRAVISRAALLHDGEVLLPAHLPANLVQAALVELPEIERSPSGMAIPTLSEIEAAHIRRVLELCDGNRTLAAQHLGITRQTLAKKLGGPPE
jgi:DNA-binding NtrC family response regulator